MKSWLRRISLSARQLDACLQGDLQTAFEQLHTSQRLEIVERLGTHSVSMLNVLDLLLRDTPLPPPERTPL